MTIIFMNTKTVNYFDSWSILLLYELFKRFFDEKEKSHWTEDNLFNMMLRCSAAALQQLPRLNGLKITKKIISTLSMRSHYVRIFSHSRHIAPHTAKLSHIKILIYNLFLKELSLRIYSLWLQKALQKRFFKIASSKSEVKPRRDHHLITRFDFWHRVNVCKFFFLHIVHQWLPIHCGGITHLVHGYFIFYLLLKFH